MKAYCQIARDSLAAARVKNKFHAGKKRQELFFEDGKLFMIGVKTRKVSKQADATNKWGAIHLDSLNILQVIGSVTYKIELSPTMERAYKVFNVSKIKKYVRFGQYTGPLSVIIDAEGKKEQDLISILDKKKGNSSSTVPCSI